jgi:hypothetical protein
MKNRISIKNRIFGVSLLITGFFFSIDVLPAQEIPKVPILTEFASIDPGIQQDKDKEEIIKSVVESLVNKYAYCADFGDEKGEFSIEKYSMFSKLFHNNAIITNYLLRKPENLETYKFTEFVYDYIKPGSLDYKFKEAELQSIKINSSGNYEALIILYKDVYSIYDQKTQEITVVSKPKSVKLYGLIILDKGFEDQALFHEMKGESKSNDASSVYFSASGIYGIGNLSNSSGGGFENLKPSTKAYGLSAEILKSISSSEKLFLWIDISYQTLDILTDYSGKYGGSVDQSNESDFISSTIYKNNTFSDSKEKSNVFITNINSGKEKIIGANLLAGMVGVGYYFSIGLKNQIIVKLGIQPTYLSNVSNGNRISTFEGYELPDKKYFPDFDEIKNNGIGDDYNYVVDKEISPGNVAPITAENNFSLSLIVAPSFQMPMGFNWGLDLGFAYSYGINNLFKQTNNTEAFLSRTDETKSIIQDFLTDSKHNQIQGKIGIYYKF